MTPGGLHLGPVVEQPGDALGPRLVRPERDLGHAHGREGEPGASRAKIGLTPALAGPVRRIAAEHLMNCYVIWKFAENPDGAQQFLVDLVGPFRRPVFRESEFYNLPCYPVDGPGPRRSELAQRPEGGPARASTRVLASAARLVHQRRVSRLRHRRHRRGLQHVRHPDDVRARRPRRGVPRGGGPGGADRDRGASSSAGARRMPELHRDFRITSRPRRGRTTRATARTIPPRSSRFLASARARRRRCAWDCATGSGQAAAGLARHFDDGRRHRRERAADRARARRIPASDIAVAPRGVERRCPTRSVELVTVAQALHWFDRPAFLGRGPPRARARRRRRGLVLRPASIVDETSTPSSTASTGTSSVRTGRPSGRSSSAATRSLEFPFDEIEARAASRWRSAGRSPSCAGYLRTWSAVRSAIVAGARRGSRSGARGGSSPTAWGPPGAPPDGAVWDLDLRADRPETLESRRAASRHVSGRPLREPPDLGHRPVQPALPVLHAGAGLRLAAARGHPRLRGDRAARRTSSRRSASTGSG